MDFDLWMFGLAGIIFAGGAVVVGGVVYVIMRKRERAAVDEVLAAGRDRWTENERTWGDRVDELEKWKFDHLHQNDELKRMIGELQVQVEDVETASAQRATQAYTKGLETGKKIELQQVEQENLIIHESRGAKTGKFKAAKKKG